MKKYIKSASSKNDFVIENGVLKKYVGRGGDVVIPDVVTSIGDRAFRWCESLTSVTIPDSVTSIGVDAFIACSALTSVTIGNGVTFIRDGAFYGCTGLTSITIPTSVTTIGKEAFSRCKSLKHVDIQNSNTKIAESAFADTPVEFQFTKKKAAKKKSKTNWASLVNEMRSEAEDGIDSFGEQTDAGVKIEHIMYEVDDEAGIFTEPSTQAGHGNIFFFLTENGEPVGGPIGEADYDEFNEGVIQILIDSSSKEEFKREYKKYLEKFIER